MSHLTHEALWAYASDDAGAHERAALKAHLETCAECAAALKKVEFAQSVLRPGGQVPPLTDAAARRIGNVLAEAAEAQAMKKMRWSFLRWKPLALVAVAALLMWFLWPSKPVEPPPEVAIPTPEHQPEPLVEPQGEAQVTSARKAKIEGGTLAKSQKLSAGTKVSTEAGGALWLKLPDGTRAGLTAQTEVTLEAMGDKRVALEVKKGNLLVVAKHDPNRQLHVYAGEVEVRDVGTRFLVAREERKVGVAVEEGEVEVRVGDKVVPVKAGQGVEIARGRMREVPLKAPPEPKPVETPVQKPVEQPVAPPTEAGTPPIAQAPEPVAPPPPVEQPAPPPVPAPAPPPLTTAAPPSAAPPAQSVAAQEEEELNGIALAFKRFGEALARPFLPTRGMLADRVDALATEGNCADAHREAKEWLAKDAGSTAEEVQLRRVVLKAQLRCYTRSGKTSEADAVRRQIQP